LSLLQRIFGRTLSPAWEIAPGEIVWKLQPTGSGVLLGESRDVERKMMTIFALRPAEGRTLFSGVALDEPWWVALEMTIGDVAIFHSFPRPDLPNAIGATAIDCATGEVLWRDDTMRVLCGVEELALVQRGDTLDFSSLALIDVRSAAVLEEIGQNPERVGAFQQACAAPAQWSGWINAEEVEQGSPAAITIESYLSPIIKERRGTIESAELNGYTIAAAHSRSRRSADAMLGGAVDTHLVVASEGRVQYHEIITKDAPGPAGDSFFIWNGVLVFIRDRRTLVGINLNRQ
jgi:hypothetical protein